MFAERIDRKLYHNTDYPIDGEILNSLNDSSRLGKYFNNGNATNIVTLRNYFKSESPIIIGASLLIIKKDW